MRNTNKLMTNQLDTMTVDTDSYILVLSRILAALASNNVDIHGEETLFIPLHSQDKYQNAVF